MVGWVRQRYRQRQRSKSAAGGRRPPACRRTCPSHLFVSSRFLLNSSSNSNLKYGGGNATHMLGQHWGMQICSSWW